MSKEKIVNFVLAFIGLSVVGCIIFVAFYFFSSSAPEQQTISANQTTADQLSKRTQKYVDCKYSTNTMETVGIGLGFIEANNIMDMSTRSKVLDTNDELDKYVSNKCASFMKQYEEDFEQLKAANEKMYIATLSRWDSWRNSDPELPIPAEQAKIDPLCFETIPALYCDVGEYEAKHILSDKEIVKFYSDRL